MYMYMYIYIYIYIYQPIHDDVGETLQLLLALCEGNSPVN